MLKIQNLYEEGLKISFEVKEKLFNAEEIEETKHFPRRLAIVVTSGRGRVVN